MNLKTRASLPVVVRTFACRAAIVPAVLAIAGCASLGTAGVLSKDKAAIMSGLTPFEFVRKRFYDEAKSPVLEGIDNAAYAYAKFISNIQGRDDPQRGDSIPRPELDEKTRTVTWPAYFTDRNYVQLVRPMAELKRYCEARQGQWQTLEVFDEDPIAKLRRNPIVDYLDAQARVTRHLQSQGAYVGFEEIRDLIASDVGVEMAREARQINRSNEGLFSVSGFNYAQRLKSFGVFACQSGSVPTWYASVMPAMLIPRDPGNQFDPSTARLAIRVYAR